jgi:hypothetical protein
MNWLAVTVWILPFRHHSSCDVLRFRTVLRPKRQAAVFVNYSDFKPSELSEKLRSAGEVKR